MRALLIVLAVVAACAASNPAVKAGDPVPPFELALLDGGTWRSDQARGQVVVLDVWASWCKPCRKGFPALDALARRRPEVVVVAVSIDEDAAAMRGFLAETPLAVPVAHDPAQTLTRPPLSVARLPTVLVIDREGRVRHRLVEPSERDYRELDRLVAEVLHASL